MAASLELRRYNPTNFDTNNPNPRFRIKDSNDNLENWTINSGTFDWTLAYPKIKSTTEVSVTPSTTPSYKSVLVAASADADTDFSVIFESDDLSWNIGSASYDSVSFSVGSEDPSPRGLFFKDDGTKMYMLGNFTNNVYQYSLSTAWDISTASYDSVSFSVGTEDGAPEGLFFKSDGTKMYIVGGNNDNIYQYTLSTAWDISSASYDSVSFSVGTEDASPLGIFFKDDGTKMYMLGNVNVNVYQYTLSTAWDLSTASYDSVSFSVSSEDPSPRGLFFKDDGFKLFVIGTSNDNVYQYTSAVNFSSSSGQDDLLLGSVVSNTSLTNDLTIRVSNDSENGKNVYLYQVAFFEEELVFEEMFDTAQTWSFDSTNMNLFKGWSHDSSDALYDDGGNRLGFDDASYLLSWLPTFTGTYNNIKDVQFWINDNDYSTEAGVSGSTPNATGMDQTADTRLWFYETDGTNARNSGTSNGFPEVFTGPLSKALGLDDINPIWDVSGASYDSVSFPVGTEDGFPTGLFFKSDGTKMYMVGDVNDNVYQYTLSTAWDLSTASYDSVSFSFSTEDSSSIGLFFKDDGTKMYMVGASNDNVYQYTLSTAWDLSTASYDSVSFSVGSEDSAPEGLFFKDDGTKMYIVGIENDNIYQYTLSTAWDLSTASYDSVSFSVGTEDNVPTGIFFKDDGTKMFMVGAENDNVYQYSLSTAWDLSIASYDDVFTSISDEDIVPQEIFFKSDGTKMYMVGAENDNVYQYTIVMNPLSLVLKSIEPEQTSKSLTLLENSLLDSTVSSDTDTMTIEPIHSGNKHTLSRDSNSTSVEAGWILGTDPFPQNATNPITMQAQTLANPNDVDTVTMNVNFSWTETA